MAITAREFLINPRLLGGTPHQYSSPEEVDAHDDPGNYLTKSGMPADEYYSALGKLVDEHPIVTARIRR